MPETEMQPKRESYTICKPCSEAEGEVVLYHRSQLKYQEPFWGGDAYWQCPNGHKVEPPKVVPNGAKA